MSRLISRILLTILMFPLASLVYLIAFALCLQWLEGIPGNYSHRERQSFVVGGAIAWMFLAIYWFLLWRESTRWSRSRRVRTLLMALAAAVASVAIAAPIGAIIDVGLAIFVASTSAPLLWLTATIFIWRETDAERAARLSHLGSEALVCPACGYNLTGLREARCPECGAQYTLNDLLASQPARASTEIERL
jgi:hypothetical protein